MQALLSARCSLGSAIPNQAWMALAAPIFAFLHLHLIQFFMHHLWLGMP
jgi:hypothetical protein